jgi:hypothetical protein
MSKPATEVFSYSAGDLHEFVSIAVCGDGSLQIRVRSEPVKYEHFIESGDFATMNLPASFLPALIRAIEQLKAIE